MAQKNNNKSNEGIGKHLGDLSPSKAVKTAAELRDRDWRSRDTKSR